MKTRPKITLDHAIMPDNQFGVLYLRMDRRIHASFSVGTYGASDLCVVYEPTVADMRAVRDSLTRAITAFHLAGLGKEARGE